MPEKENEEARLSRKEKKGKGAGKAHAVAAWEWFKSAAWLQVLLIVGVVVSIVVSIPYITKAIVNSTTNSQSNFFKKKRISYSQLEGYLDGSNKDCNGTIGDGNAKIDENKVGFVVMFYKSNCDACSSMQKGVETWYNDYNKRFAKKNLKFYTIDVSWVKDDAKATTKKQGNLADYKNSDITLQQQFDVQQAVKDVYLHQDDAHKNSKVTETILNTRLDAPTAGGTLPTPLFITFIKDKSAANYITDAAGYSADTSSDKNVIRYTTPARVTFNEIGGLDISAYANIATQMLDIYNFEIYKK